MTMVMEQQRHYGGSMYDGSSMYSSHMNQPQFNDPWRNGSTYSSLQNQDNRPAGMMQYPQIPSTTIAPELPRTTQESSYVSPPTASYNMPSFGSLAYSQNLHQQQQQQQQQRKLSDPYSAEMNASQSLVGLRHQQNMPLGHNAFGGDSMTTPRNIYDVRAQRGSESSFPFPAAASNNSSISAESGRSFPSYYSGSVASQDSATDYSSAASDTGDYSLASSRTLPRPQQLMGANIPAPASMMGQFSSKMSSNTQKKHKCKVCDKRFTRPSSLQTHMYSHTGEKPFACQEPGCGRHFSVVSNLRRHRKVHKGESVSSHSDAED